MAYANLALKFSTHLLPHACSSRMSTPRLKRSQSITTLEIHPLNLAYRTAASGKKLLRTQGFANTTFDLEESASGVGRCCRHRFGYAFGDIMAKRHSPAVKFDPPSLYHPRTIDDPLAMIELFSSHLMNCARTENRSALRRCTILPRRNPEVEIW